jgi:hypothetical protein
MKWFIYAWEANPDASRLVGPYESKEEALSWLEDHKEELPGWQVGLIPLTIHRVNLETFTIEQ